MPKTSEKPVKGKTGAPRMNRDRKVTGSGVDEYIAAATPEVRPVLQRIRRIVKQAVPDAIETISYRIPALRLGKVFLYFAAFKNHIGVYPPVKGDAKLEKELEQYRGEKGNLKFPLSKPIPDELIARVAKALARAYGEAKV